MKTLMLALYFLRDLDKPVRLVNIIEILLLWEILILLLKAFLFDKFGFFNWSYFD